MLNILQAKTIDLVCVLPRPGLAFKGAFQLFKSADLNTSIKEDTLHTQLWKLIHSKIIYLQ